MALRRASQGARHAFTRAFSATAHPAPLFFRAADKSIISPWHDIPLRAAGANPAIVNFVCEIPTGTTPKFEIDTGAAYNPIVQDVTKKGEPRFYALKSIINYGALPQTFEDPAHKDSWTQHLGDGDPIDVCDISTLPASTGSVYTVKVLGALAMIDGGECDWKLLAIRTDDPLAASLTSVHTAPDAVKRKADDIREWFRTYKIPEGKGENSFALDGKWLHADTALEVIESTYKQWQATLTAPKTKKSPWVPTASGWKAAAPGTHAGAGAALNITTSTTGPA